MAYSARDCLSMVERLREVKKDVANVQLDASSDTAERWTLGLQEYGCSKSRKSER